MAIHPTAIISKEAVIHESCEIGPYVIIEGRAKLGQNNRVLASAFIGDGTTLGNNNEIHMGAVVGHTPQDKSFQNQETFLKIGNNNIIREHVSIHRATTLGGSTIIGNNCLLMGGCHIAHDCHIGDNVIMANMAGIAGHVEVGDRAFIGGGAMMHQFVRVGRVAIVAGNARISMDIPPFMIAAERNQVWGINVIGLRRAGFSPQTILELRELYRMFFRTPAPRTQLLENIRVHAFTASEVKEFVTFIESSKRGVCRAKLDNPANSEECQ